MTGGERMIRCRVAVPTGLFGRPFGAEYQEPYHVAVDRRLAGMVLTLESLGPTLPPQIRYLLEHHGGPEVAAEAVQLAESSRFGTSAELAVARGRWERRVESVLASLDVGLQRCLEPALTITREILDENLRHRGKQH